MPPTLPHRSLSSSLPTVVSLSKLFHLVPQLFSSSTSRGHVKRGAEWVIMEAAKGPIEPEDPPDSPQFWWKLGLSAVLVLLGGVFAGLTLALMGSDDLNLRVLSTSSEDEKERKAAAKVLRLLARGRHWVLVVLLLGNVIVNESLPIFLDDVLGGGVKAVIVSTTMIVIFGEIIPQAVCVRYGLSIGGVCAPLVLGMMILFAPIAWPIAKLLDYVLGSESGNTYKKAELKSFLQFHREGEEPLRDDEIGILNGVLSLNDKEAKEIMTPIADCLTLPSDKILDHEAIDHILLSGFSRIPIHEPGQKDNFIGMLLVKRLITYSPEDEWPVSKFPLLPLPEARPNINCFQALDYFQTGRAHLLLISNTPGRKGGAIGIVSLEDLIEEIIGEEIVDETDRFQDNKSHKVAKRAGTAAVMRGIIERQRVIGALSRRPSRQGTDAMTTKVEQTNGGPHDGLLIQMHDGNMVAEPVNVTDDLQAQGKSAKRLVVGNGDGMDSIAEGSGTSDRDTSSPLIAPHGENGVEREGVTADVAGEMEIRDDDGKLTLKVTGDTDLLNDLAPEQAVNDLMFESYDAFEVTSNTFVKKYNGKSKVIGPERTNVGWEWREGSKYKWFKGEGYLLKRVNTCLAIDKSETDGEEEDLEQDEQAALIPSTANASQDEVQVEYSIVYSKTYHVPQLLIRAWDSDGAPLSLDRLVRTGIIKSASSGREDGIMLQPNSPFPLLQQTEHPATGDTVWGIHPCQVGTAVREVLAAEDGYEGDEADVRLRWLETWMMLSSGIVDLTW